MEVYIFDKNRRCPYLHYAFLTTEIERYAIENLDWSNGEHKVDIPFLYKWLSDVKRHQGLYTQHLLLTTKHSLKLPQAAF